MDDEIEAASGDNGFGAERAPELGRGVFEVAVYRSVVHHASLRVDAESSEVARDHVAGFLDQLGAEDSSGSGWSHARTELGVRYVKREAP